MIEQLEYRTGQTDYLGQMWTWVSGEAAVVVDPNALIGWLEYASNDNRLHYKSASNRLHFASHDNRLQYSAHEPE